MYETIQTVNLIGKRLCFNASRVSGCQLRGGSHLVSQAILKRRFAGSFNCYSCRLRQPLPHSDEGIFDGVEGDKR